MSRQSRRNHPQIKTTGQDVLKSMAMSGMMGGTTANMNFDPEGIGAMTNPGDVDPDIYAGKDMSAYKGMTPIEIANTPVRPTGEFQDALGNPSNSINTEYRISTAERKAALGDAKTMEGLAQENRLSLKGVEQKYAKENALLDHALAFARTNNVPQEYIDTPEFKNAVIESFHAKQGAETAENKRKTTASTQSDMALQKDTSLIPRELAADVRQKEGNAAQASWRRTVPGTSDIMLKPSGFPTSLSITQGLPLEENVMMTIGGQEFPTGKTRSTMQRPIMQGIPLNEFGEDTPTPVNRPTTIGSPYPQLNAAPRGITQPQQPVNKPTTAEPSTEDKGLTSISLARV